MGWGWAGAGVISKTILFYFILLLYKYMIKGKIPVAIWAAVRGVWAAARAVVVFPLPSALASWSSHVLSVMISLFFPFYFTFSILIPFYSIRTVLPFLSHVTSPRGFPRFPYLWLTSLEAYFLFFSGTALHSQALPYDSHWLPFTSRLCLPFISPPYDLLWLDPYLSRTTLSRTIYV